MRIEEFCWNIQAVTSEAQYEVTGKMLDYAEKKGVKFIITLGGYGTGRMVEEQTIKTDSTVVDQVTSYTYLRSTWSPEDYAGYYVLLGYSDCLMATDEILRSILVQPEFQKEMGTAEFHYLLGKYAAEWERKTHCRDTSLLACAYRLGIPIYTSSPGDSTLGMNVAEAEINGQNIRINPLADHFSRQCSDLQSRRLHSIPRRDIWRGTSLRSFFRHTRSVLQAPRYVDQCKS
jgi:hypothetical protein